MPDIADPAQKPAVPAAKEMKRDDSGRGFGDPRLGHRPESDALRRSAALLNTRPVLATQRKAAATLESARPAPPAPRNRTGLPDRLKAGVEALSGIAMDDVRVHRGSSEPEKLGAHAFTRGSDIHLAPGQERHLRHEAWHVVQQKQGRVRATVAFAGSQINDDPRLETEADRMGARAAGVTAITRQPESLAAQPAIQRAPVIQRVINLTDAVEVKPGPPPTVSKDGWFYKVFAQNKKDKAEAIYAEWKAADDGAVPVPRFEVKSVTVNNTPKWAFRSKAAEGTFFQFSKHGHTDSVVQWVMSQTDRIALGRLKKIFDHVAAKLGDGQGFFVDGSSKILFIDINTGGTTPGAADAATACTTRLGQL